MTDKAVPEAVKVIDKLRKIAATTSREDLLKELAKLEFEIVLAHQEFVDYSFQEPLSPDSGDDDLGLTFVNEGAGGALPYAYVFSADGRSFFGDKRTLRLTLGEALRIVGNNLRHPQVG